MQMASSAVFIGRFQPLHKGHVFALEKIAKKHKTVYIVIGSAQKKNEKENPFSLVQRKKMLKMVLASITKKSGLHAKFQIFSLEDDPSNGAWLDNFFGTVSKFDVAYSNNPLVQRLLRSRGVIVKSTGSLKRPSYQGKAIRSKMIAGKKWQDSVPAEVAAYFIAVSQNSSAFSSQRKCLMHFAVAKCTSTAT